MAFVDAALAVGSFVGADALGAGAATLIGGGILGAGAGALYGGLTGGNVGKDALTGGMLGAAGAGIGSAMGAGAAAPATVPEAAGPAATAFTPETGAVVNPGFVNAGMEPDVAMTPTQQLQSQMEAQDLENGANAGTGTGVTSTAGSSLGNGFQQALNWMGNNKGLTAGAALLGISALGGNKPTTYTTPGSQNTMNTGYFKLNPATFQPTRMPVTTPIGGVKPSYPDYQQNPYNYQGYAAGGIASLSAGDAVSKYKEYQDESSMLSNYENMLTGQGRTASQEATPSWVTSSGVYSDVDPNTRNLSAYDAAKYRLAHAYASSGAPTSAGLGIAGPTVSYGQINTDPAMVQAAQAAQQQQTQGAAQGGIIGYNHGGGVGNLGGYASGGNPHLLKGPGDGMSDSIPASIDNKQPARLADGEFVVPADVVSHLGNGSTDAGAKKLHGMMSKVRQKRTGKKKQAPEINPDQFMPK